MCKYMGVHVRRGACLLGLITLALTIFSGCAHMGVPLCYKRVFTTENGHVVVLEWGKDSTDPDGECVEVRVEGCDGCTDKCNFEVWGRVIDSWVADLDADGKPEVVVVSQSFGTGVYGEVRVVTMAATGLSVVNFPSEAGDSEIGYMGHDNFSRDGRRIVRTFPIYAANDPNCCPTGGSRKIIYEFNGKKLVPVELKDSDKEP